MIETASIVLISIVIGYLLGSRKEKEIIRERIERIKIKDKPKPGVVNHLTEEEMAIKHDLKKQGELEVFDKFMATQGIKREGKKITYERT